MKSSMLSCCVPLILMAVLSDMKLLLIKTKTKTPIKYSDYQTEYYGDSKADDVDVYDDDVCIIEFLVVCCKYLISALVSISCFPLS